MSTPTDEQGAGRSSPGASDSAIETLARELSALLDEFETEISEGHVAAAFADRLSHIRDAVARLLD